MDFKNFLRGDVDVAPGGSLHHPPPPPLSTTIVTSLVDEPIDGDVPGQETKFDFDLIVLGGGSGGISCAKRAAELGARVALCDFVRPSPAGSTWGLGGTCVNVGCIPKKLFHQAALIGEQRRHAAESFGWCPPDIETEKHVNWSVLTSNVKDHIQSLNYGYEMDLEKKNVTYFNAFAQFVDGHRIKLCCPIGPLDKREVTSRRFVLAMGGRPTLPSDVPGAVQHSISSDDLFTLPQAPGKTLVVGASYVALECAGFLTGLGFHATVMMRSIPLRGFDQDMAEKVVEFMELQGTRFLKGVVPTRVDVDPFTNTKVVTYARTIKAEGNTMEEHFDTVLFAVGRRPEILAVNPSAAGGIQLAPNTGKIVVDQFERTSVPHIYAVGDIIEGGLELTPVAIRAGKLLAERLYGRSVQVMQYTGVPTCVFTPLEYGCVGLSEEAALERYGVIEVYHSYMTPLEWTVPHLPENGSYVKVIVNPFDNERVIGFHILSPNAGEITQGMAVALRAKITKAVLDETVGIHPTIGEEMTILKVTKSSGANAKKTGC